MITSLNKKTGFTIIELMLVVAIMALLASIILTTVSSSRAKAKDANIITEAHTIRIALEEYNTAHGGFPNPQNNDKSSNDMYCVGSTDCVFNGVYINTQLKGPDIAFKKINSNLLASSFPVYTSEQVPTLDDNNKGFIYIACGGSSDTCPNDQAILMYPKLVQNSFSVLNVGTFDEVTCGIAQCQDNYGHNCGNGTEICTNFSSVSGACNFDVNGTGSSSGACTCGENSNASCANYCGDSGSNNGCSYDPNGTGSCNCNTLQYSENSYPYCTGSSNASGYNYDSGNSGWCSNYGYTYYSSSVPSNYPYYNGTGNCISINVSSSYGNGQSGSYCDTPYDPGYTESSYPWFTSDSTAQYYGYSYGNGWSGYGYYGTSYPSGYSNPNGSGSCIYVSVSSTYGNGYQTTNYCTSQNMIYGCTDGSACNYNSSANYNDGSCEYNSCHNNTVYGCTDGSACNYNSSANSNDGSCEYTSCHNTVYGCTNSSACNYNSSANYDDGSCDYTSCHSYSCQGTPSCDYYSSWDCSGSHSYCSWTANTSNYCGGSTYSIYHNCSDFDYNSCPSNGYCSPYDDGNGNQYCSGSSYYDYGNCSDINYDNCSSYSGCYQSSMESGGTCSPNTSCGNYNDQYSCGNISGCSWTY